MPYNLSDMMNNSTGIVEFAQGINEHLMGNSLGFLLLFSLSIIVLLSYFQATGSVRKSLTAASFVAFGLSLFFRALSLIPDKVFFVTLILCAVIVAFSWRD